MNPAKLEALRRKYANAKGGDIFDPAFAAVAATVFADADKRKWPFAGVATLSGRADPHSWVRGRDGSGEFGDIDVALVGVPMDLGVTNRAGARLGPRAVRAVERIGPYEHVLKIAPMGALEGRRRRRRADGKPLLARRSASPTSRRSSAGCARPT